MKYRSLLLLVTFSLVSAEIIAQVGNFRKISNDIAGNNNLRRDNQIPQDAYLFPYRQGTEFVMANGPNGYGWHAGKYAYDWLMPVGTPLYAARSGKVVKIKADSNRGGASQSYMNDANFVIIRHSDGTFANYLHLAYNSVTVREGQDVMVGDRIGSSGNTGWTTDPHLHFHVSGAGDVTLPLKFLTNPNMVEELQKGQKYRAYHPWCVSCQTGNFDGVNCQVYTWEKLSLSGDKDDYWYDGKHGNVYTKAKRGKCSQGHFDGVNCIVKTWGDMNMPGTAADYWYDKKYGSIYRKAGMHCTH